MMEVEYKHEALSSDHNDQISVAGGSSRRFFDKLNKIAKNLEIFMEIDLIKYYHLIFFS